MLNNQIAIYEKLDDVTSIRGFIITAVSLFEQGIEQLINRVFLKTDFTVKSVVDSLLYQSGPLCELPIRVKVLFGLGVISHQVFEDINAFLKLKEQLNNQVDEPAFIDPIIIQFIQQLHHQQEKNIVLEDLSQENQDSLLYQVKMMRQVKLLRSYLILAISNITEKLYIDSPL